MRHREGVVPQAGSPLRSCLIINCLHYGSITPPFRRRPIYAATPVPTCPRPATAWRPARLARTAQTGPRLAAGPLRAGPGQPPSILHQSDTSSARPIEHIYIKHADTPELSRSQKPAWAAQRVDPQPTAGRDQLVPPAPDRAELQHFNDKLGWADFQVRSATASVTTRPSSTARSRSPGTPGSTHRTPTTRPRRPRSYIRSTPERGGARADRTAAYPADPRRHAPKIIPQWTPAQARRPRSPDSDDLNSYDQLPPVPPHIPERSRLR